MLMHVFLEACPTVVIQAASHMHGGYNQENIISQVVQP